MRKLLLVSAAVITLAPSAYALNDDVATNSANGNSYAQQNTGTIQNSTLYNGAGAGGATATTANTFSPTNNATGGQGGSVSNAGNSTNFNTNTARGGRGGDGGTGIGIGGSSDSHANAIGLGGDSSALGVGGEQSQSATTGDQSINVEAQKRNPVATAFSAPLVASEDTCMGSSSAGGQGVGFGLSFGSTWTDGDCVRRKDARELHNMGYKPAAIALMCQNENVAQAMATAGTPCRGSQQVASSVATDQTDRYGYPVTGNQSKH